MPSRQFADNLYKLASGHALTPAEAEALRQSARNIEAYSDTLGNLTTPDGFLAQDVFDKRSRQFSILPHECASLRFGTQAITNNSSTVPAVSSPNAATWAYGMSIDISSGLINITGLANQSVYMFTAWWQWAANSSGYRELQWDAIPSGGVFDRRLNVDATLSTYNSITHVRRAVDSETSYRILVKQTSGGDLNGDGILTAVRIR